MFLVDGPPPPPPQYLFLIQLLLKPKIEFLHKSFGHFYQFYVYATLFICYKPIFRTYVPMMIPKRFHFLMT